MLWTQIGSERILGWFANVATSISDSIRENVRTIGGAFCGLFVSSLVVCFLVAFLYVDEWDTQWPIGVVADVSGASFAAAIVILSFGRTAMSLNRIFKRKEREQGRQEGRQEGRTETANEYIRAYANLRPGESLQEAVERLRKEKGDSLE